MSPLSRAVVWVLQVPLRLYRALISPLLPRLCRFHPSCSVYAMGALQVHGPVKGSWLTLRRLSRCHPFHPGGLDPVPPASELCAWAASGRGEDEGAPQGASSVGVANRVGRDAVFALPVRPSAEKVS